MSIIPYDKISRLFRILRQHGGLFRSFVKLWKMDTLKEGKFMGQDILGNKYYENNYYMISRNRWVEFNPAVGWEYDASQVSPEWFGWLHYKTDLLPCEDMAKNGLSCCSWCQCWLLPPEENMTATPRAYYPYSTTRPHINLWNLHCTCDRKALSK